MAVITTGNIDVNIDPDDPEMNFISVEDVVDPQKAHTIAKEVANLPFSHKRLDLHSIYQTADFSELDLPEECQNFVTFMKTVFKDAMESSFKMKLSHITMTASKYMQNDFLLCHDDKVDDRAIAFVYYLNEDWEEADGGKLRFFQVEDGKPIHKYCREVTPQFNTMAVFKVTDTSFHEVEEVYGRKKRLTINGWYHSVDKTPRCNSSVDLEPVNKEPFYRGLLLSFTSKIRTPDSLTSMFVCDFRSLFPSIKKTIADNYYFLAVEILNKKKYESMFEELSNIENDKWILRGPAERRKYETLDLFQDGNDICLPSDVEAPTLKNLLKFLVSHFWIKTLQKMTGMEYGILEEGYEPPTSLIEVQRWKSGDYLLIGDNEVMFGLPYLEVTFFIGVNEQRMGGFNTKTNKEGYDMCGDIVFSFPDYKSTDVDYKWLKQQKYEQMKNRVIRADKKRKLMGKTSEHTLKERLGLAKQIVTAKVENIASYRRRNFLAEDTCHMVPTSNSMLITLCNEDTKKFCYLNKRHDEDDTFHYFSVSITYLLS